MAERTVFLVYGYDNYEYPYDPIKAFASEEGARAFLAELYEYHGRRPPYPSEDVADDEHEAWWSEHEKWIAGHPGKDAWSHDGYSLMTLPMEDPAMADLIAELEGVVGLCDKASAMLPSAEGDAAIKDAETAATNWVIAHHAEIAEAVRDKKMLDWLERHPRMAEVEVDGKVEDCYVYAVAGDPGFKLREVIRAAMDSERRRSPRGASV